MDWATLPIDKLGVVGIVVVFGLLVARGSLVPRIVVKDLTTSRDERIKELAAERDARTSANEALMEALRVRDEQLRELMELAKTANALLGALTKGREI
ncbi:MAG TPA: hypothetical protein VLT90_13005 [Terriglobales bacterium]|nr:hypothetical protein [Terriglobales bacterium]